MSRGERIGCAVWLLVICLGSWLAFRHPHRQHDMTAARKLSGELHSLADRLDKDSERLSDRTEAASRIDSRHAAMTFIVNTAGGDAERVAAITALRQIDKTFVPFQRAGPRKTAQEEEDAHDDAYDY